MTRRELLASTAAIMALPGALPLPEPAVFVDDVGGPFTVTAESLATMRGFRVAQHMTDFHAWFDLSGDARQFIDGLGRS